MGARLGQHFLKDPAVAGKIIAAAGPLQGSEVLEIGPGRGILTERLLAAGARVTAVELDRRLFEELKGRFRDHGRLALVHADFLKLQAADLPPLSAVVANLPYAVASPILQKLLAMSWRAAVLMFQREVAERVAAPPGSRKYGLLSISVALRARVERVCDVPRSRFSPPPRVDSAVVRLDRLPEPSWPAGLDEGRFWEVVRAAFGQRRKRAANALARALELPRERVEEALVSAGVSPGARAEEIPLNGFLDIAASLFSMVSPS